MVRRIISFSFWVFVISSLLIQTVRAQVLPQDSLALVALFDSTDGQNWKNNNNWLSSEPIDNWYGVTVESNRITGLVLRNNNLTGSIPAEICNLTELDVLDFYVNALHSHIPPDIDNLTKLTRLYLNHNQLDGTIPAGIWQLTGLEQLYLNSNQLSGTLSDSLGNLINLEYLVLFANDFEGPIPGSIANLTRLREFNIYRNGFSGPLPAGITGLDSLRQLIMWNNILEGNLPGEIGNLKYLERLEISNNRFTGDIPESIGSLTHLTFLDLRSNRFTGAIPISIGNLTNLTFLGLSSNDLTGSIPDTLGSLINVTTIYLNYNELSGTIPASLGNISGLKALLMNSNHLSGAVPEQVTYLTNINTFYIDNNRLDQLPDLTPMSSLISLSIHHNRFTFEDIEPNMSFSDGTFYYTPQDSVGIPIDTTVESGSELVLVTEVGGRFNVYQWYKDYLPIDGANDSTLILSPVAFSDAGTYTCHITNTVVTDLTLYHHPFFVHIHLAPREADSLALIDLYDNTNGNEWSTNTNWLTTESLETWHGVTVENNRVAALDLHENNLDGSVPALLGNLTGLTYLSLRNNNLSGALPDEIGNMTEMTDLDFAFNNLTGEIPETIGDLANLNALFLDFNALEGTIPLSLGNLKNLMAIYLGGNNLTGGIPDTLGTLLKLTVFHLQDNNLTGPVPASLGNLTQLEAINLEHNHFINFPDISDNIPPLQELQLSHNNFVFDDIEPYINAGLTTLTYSDQDSVHTGMDTTITEGDDLMFTALVGGSANVYQWKKDGVDLAGSQNSAYTISSATLNDAGFYHCEITSPIVPDLTLYSRKVHVTVEEATNITEPLSDIPGEYNLHQNYPNPFNPVTVIRYDLPAGGNVEITIHNILGQKLATLIAQKQPAGYYQIQYDGSGMSSGVYFYKITTDEFTQIKKMILLQ